MAIEGIAGELGIRESGFADPGSEDVVDEFDEVVSVGRDTWSGSGRTCFADWRLKVVGALLTVWRVWN